MSTQRRERAVCCRDCGPRVTTWNVTALCESCTRVADAQVVDDHESARLGCLYRLAGLVKNPTQITESLWSPTPEATVPPLDVAMARVNLDG